MSNNVHDLSTPCLILDKSKLYKNAQRLAERAHDFKVHLRPHLKTAKSHEVARIATNSHFGGITVSTLREAEYFAGHGFTDITYAVCITPNKLARAESLVNQGIDLKIITDSVEVAQALSKRPALHRVLIEIDCGEHRTGTSPDGDTFMQIARVLNDAKNVELLGVLTHGGHSYACKSIEEVIQVAEQERQLAVKAAERLRQEGMSVSCVSIGSTPTACFAESFDGVTEIRPGVYLFGDLFQAGLGVCSENEIAVSVLASVISINEKRNSFVIDAGGLALSKDRSTANSPKDMGFGKVVGLSMEYSEFNLTIKEVHQEHGEVYCDDANFPWEQLKVGEPVMVLVNHICMTAAMYDEYIVVDSEKVITRWSRINGW
ncbi:MAG: alanine racemase [Myxococcota bacterium]|nr:alanine racemase [Myxococcota bacterium]